MRLILLAMLGLVTLPVLSAEWKIDHENSRLGFVGLQGGAEFEGSFHNWQAIMVFDPTDLNTSQFDVQIDVTSVDTQSADRDSIIGDPEWFGFTEFPAAQFQTTSFASLGDDRYEALGTLTIRGVSQDIRLPFSWVVDGDTAKMDGEAVLDRTDYNVGTGDWASEDMVAHSVTVVVDLNLQKVSN